MVGAGFRLLPRSPRFRRWASSLCVAGLPVLAAGCTTSLVKVTYSRPIPAQTTAAASAWATTPAAAGNGVQLASYEPGRDNKPPAVLPAPETLSVPPHTSEASPMRLPVAQPGPTPVNLDSVFRLAEQQNALVAAEREKLNQTQLEAELAAKGWMPKVTAGVGYYRHEGGIQNEDGTLTRSSFGALYPGVDMHAAFDIHEATFQRVDAQRKQWQQKGELSRVDNDTLLQAANTYIDLLTAQRSEGVARELEKYHRDLLKRAQATAPEGGKVLAESVQAELRGILQTEARLNQQGDAASAKLAYLLGMDPLCPLVSVDETLAPIDLVDATAPTPVLVSRALADGPGVHELQGLLAVIDCGLADMSSPKMFLPKVELCMGEGAFAAGPDSTLTWVNRFDVGVQARWDLTEMLKARDEKRIAESKRRQVQLNYDDLRAKLTLGVREAREAILSGRQQIEEASEQIRQASEAYRLSDLRLKQNAPGSSAAEVMQALRGLEEAHFNYINSVSAYNKAEIRLLLVLGPAGACKAAAAQTVIMESPGK